MAAHSNDVEYYNRMMKNDHKAARLRMNAHNDQFDAPNPNRYNMTVEQKPAYKHVTSFDSPVKTTKKNGKRSVKYGGASGAVDWGLGVIKHIDDGTFAQPNASADGTYSGTSNESDKWGVVQVSAEAGVGRAKAEINGICGAEAKGPNASAGASAGINGAQAFANAELCSASANLGPASVTVGLSAKTGAGITADGVEAKVLGTGFKVGPGGLQLSIFGNSIKLG